MPSTRNCQIEKHGPIVDSNACPKNKSSVSSAWPCAAIRCEGLSPQLVWLERNERQKLIEAKHKHGPRREDDAGLVDASAALDRSWDTFKDENPIGSGNNGIFNRTNLIEKRAFMYDCDYKHLVRRV
jgi:hypothetical protein